MASLFFWRWPDWQILGMLALLGIAATGSHLLFNQALRVADVNVVAPVDFLRLIWVAIIGFIFFAEVPSLFTWIGGAVILLSAMQIANDERKAVPSG
jgi:drug/metabolite transporter (DMT)-like permease